MTTTDVKVKVRLRFRQDPDGTLPRGEWLWAVPLGDGHPGAYELKNLSFYVPLRIGDVVRAGLDGQGDLQVVGLDVLEPGPMSYVAYPDDCPLEQVQRTGDGWMTRGAIWSEGTPPVLVTAWREHVRPDEVRRVLAASAPGWEVLEVLDLDARREEALDLLDLRLEHSRF